MKVYVLRESLSIVRCICKTKKRLLLKTFLSLFKRDEIFNHCFFSFLNSLIQLSRRKFCRLWTHEVFHYLNKIHHRNFFLYGYLSFAVGMTLVKLQSRLVAKKCNFHGILNCKSVQLWWRLFWALGSFSNSAHGLHHVLNNYIDTKAKCRHLKNLTCKGTPYPPSLTHCIRVYSILIHTGKGRRGSVVELTRKGKTVHKAE